MREKIKNTKGMTLIEVVLYLGLFGMFFLVMVQFFFFVGDSNQLSGESLKIDRSIIFLSQHFEDSFKKGISIDEEGTVFGSDSGQLILSVSEGGSSEPLPTSTLGASPTPTQTPVHTATPAPTVPTATPTPTPTATSTPTSTPNPTATPAPTATDTPTPSPTPSTAPLIFVGANSAATTSVSIPAHQAGDLIIIMAYRRSTTIPGLPAGWTNITTSSADASAIRLAYKIAESGSETSGTWTNAQTTAVQVFRNHDGIGAWDVGSGSGSTLNYPAVNFNVTNGSSWAAGFGGHSNATNVEQAPTGMVNYTSAGTEIAAHNTNGGVSSWSSQNVTVNTSNGWKTAVVEVRSGGVLGDSSEPLTLVSANSTTGTTISIPTHQAGDLLVLTAFRAAAILPSVPGDWTSIGSSMADSSAIVLAYKTAVSGSETSGTWTNAQFLAVEVYRYHDGIGDWNIGSGSSATLNYPAISLNVADGSSWVAGFGASVNATNIEQPPTGMVNHTSIQQSTRELAGHSTNGGVSTWTSQNVAADGSGNWKTAVIEILSEAGAEPEPSPTPVPPTPVPSLGPTPTHTPTPQPSPTSTPEPGPDFEDSPGVLQYVVSNGVLFANGTAITRSDIKVTKFLLESIKDNEDNLIGVRVKIEVSSRSDSSIKKEMSNNYLLNI